jgi:hypothetical protein
MTEAEDMAMMLNMGWGLNEIAQHYNMRVSVVTLMIVTHVKLERIRERLLASEQS